ncbi:MAG: 50S ribosomal protein L25/general stress protein Ctc [Pseudomonadota bacterium]|nr:50S ribosomal protein L25/general stress protein Ctc [Pseudomonadota bacterium]
MADAIAVTAMVREKAGKGYARAQRKAGRVPAIIYGDNQESVMISLERKEVEKLSQSTNFFTQIFELDIEGAKHQALARDLQLHPVTDGPMHVDFMRFNEKTKIVLSIPVTFINEDLSPGLKRGGVLNIVRREVELLCSPLNIPRVLVFDVDGLDIGDTIHIGAIELPDGVSATTDRDFTVATIAAPTLMPVEEEDEDGEDLEDGEEGEEGVEGESDGEPSTEEQDKSEDSDS